MKKTKKKSNRTYSTLIDFKKIQHIFLKLYEKNTLLNDLEFEKKKKEYENKTENIDYKFKNNLKNLLKLSLEKNKKFIKIKTTQLLKKIRLVKSNKKKGCFTDYKFNSKIGQGAYGTALLIEKNNTKFIAKTINLEHFVASPFNDTNMILREIENHKKMGALDVAPKFYDSYICKYNGVLTVFIIMEYMTEGTLYDYISKGNKLSSELKSKLDYKIDLMHKHNILHTDLHDQNVLLTKKDGELDIYIADWGLSMSIDNKINQQKQINKNMPYDIPLLQDKNMGVLLLTFNELLCKHVKL